MSNGNPKPSQQAQSGLATAVRSLKDDLVIVPARFAPYTPDELYQRFLLVAPDHKGNLSSTDGEYGRAVSVEVSFDFGDLILPGLASLDISAEGGGTLLQVALLIVHRCVPKTLAGPSASVPARWAGNKPVCFLSLSGQRKVLTLTLNSELSIGQALSLPESTTPEGLGLSLDLNASLNAGVSLTGQMMHLTDPAPGWYVGGGDKGLKADFNAILGQGSKKDLKEEVVAWCEYVFETAAEQLAGNNSRKVDSVKVELLRIKGIRAVEGQLKEFGSQQFMSAMNDAADDENIGNIFNQIANQIQNKIDKPTTAGLIQNLEDLQAFFKKYAKRSSTALRQYRQELTDQIQWYKDLLNAFQQGDQPSPVELQTKKNGQITALDPRYQELALLSVFSFIPSAQAGAEANAAADGSLDAGEIGANASVGASVQAEVSGQLGYTSFRYQSFGVSDKGRQPLVLTQDTVLNYRQVELTAKAMADMGVELADYNLSKSAEGEKEQSYTYNMLTYQAVLAYWQYPQADNTPSVNLESGSGLAYGMSVSFGKLVHIAKILNSNNWQVPTDNNDKDLQLFQDLAKQLRVKPEDLITFLQAADIVTESFPQLEAFTSVLLESSLAFQISSAPAMKVSRRKNSFWQSKKNPPWVLEDALKSDCAKAANSQATLTAIRLRVRLADHVENQKTIFQLGFKIAAGLKISLDKVESVGNESVLDVYVHWFGPYDPYNINNSSEAYEQSVPAVALLHQ